MKSVTTVSQARTECPTRHMYDSHTHERYEIFCFLGGSAKYYVEGHIYALGPGDILILKKAETHALLIENANPYERMVVHFQQDALLQENTDTLRDFLDNRPLGKYNLYPAEKFQDKNWLYYLQQMHQHKHSQASVNLYLTVLLHELMEAAPKLHAELPPNRDAMGGVIDYINAHLADNMTVEDICKEFYISRAQLNRKFRKMTGTSVWDYVVAKRLVLAKDLLEQGIAPTQVCTKVGFRDYSPFYRAYKVKFGVSPKEHCGGR